MVWGSRQYESDKKGFCGVLTKALCWRRDEMCNATGTLQSLAYTRTFIAHLVCLLRRDNEATIETKELNAIKSKKQCELSSFVRTLDIIILSTVI